MEKDLGVHGNLFGGIMLSWLDEAAATMAYEVCRSPSMVTLKIEEVLFGKPVKIGFHLTRPLYSRAIRDFPASVYVTPVINAKIIKFILLLYTAIYFAITLCNY